MLYLWTWNHNGHELEIEPWSTGETKNQAILPLQHQATSVVLDVCLFVFGDGGQMEGKDEKSLVAEPGPCVHCSGTAQLKLCPAGSLGTECAGSTRLYAMLVCASPRNLLGCQRVDRGGNRAGLLPGCILTFRIVLGVS